VAVVGGDWTMPANAQFWICFPAARTAWVAA